MVKFIKFRGSNFFEVPKFLKMFILKIIGHVPNTEADDNEEELENLLLLLQHI